MADKRAKFAWDEEKTATFLDTLAATCNVSAAARAIGVQDVALVYKRRRRDAYQFQVLWRGIERSEDNPSWEPWTNESLRASEPFRTYCSRSDVQAELGRDFLPSEAETSSAAKKSKKNA